MLNINIRRTIGIICCRLPGLQLHSCLSIRYHITIGIITSLVTRKPLPVVFSLVKMYNIFAGSGQRDCHSHQRPPMDTWHLPAGLLQGRHISHKGAALVVCSIGANSMTQRVPSILKLFGFSKNFAAAKKSPVFFQRFLCSHTKPVQRKSSPVLYPAKQIFPLLCISSGGGFLSSGC